MVGRLRSATAAGARVASWLVLLLALAAVVLAVLVPRLAGATPYTVLTGSMSPEHPPGTLVVVRPVPSAEIGVGDVITYQLESGEGTVVTHRVVEQGVQSDGEAWFRTQGDANAVPDAETVREVQVRGRLWYSVPHLGRASALLTGDSRVLLTYGVAGLLALYAASMFTSTLAERRRRPATGRHVAGAEPTTEATPHPTEEGART
ncbi:signal peptidase I [Nocardioides zeae]|uniref:Signal peptidase I n=1 Tax=Nocardioides imazamoxiresistens TaxID=3231893 RepID=A0ABU3PUD3_9ACTN|nr:signal peptidase I [Nocardioides zeae]MDT9592521.1 signal peptidase I [Nocardioides zeae]